MKIECVKEKLLEAVHIAEKITGKNLTLPILSTILIETKQSKIVIKATNLDLGIEIEVPAKITTPGQFSVSGIILLGFLANTDSEKVSLELIEGTLHVTSGKASATIKTFASEEFPIIPRIASPKILELDTAHFIEGLRSVWFSAAPSSVKPELSSVYVYSDGEHMVFVATDSFRLAEKKVAAKKARDFPGILIPFKNVGEIIRVLDTTEGTVLVSIDGNQISFEKDSLYLVSRVIDASFPDYKQIIPKESKTEAVLLKQDLVTALKIANVFSDSFNQVVMKVIPGQKLFEMTTKNSQVGENVTLLEAALTGEDVTISFNYKYIVDCFSSIKSDSVTLSFQGLGRPVLLRGVSDKSFQYIVMPMNK